MRIAAKNKVHRFLMGEYPVCGNFYLTHCNLGGSPNSTCNNTSDFSSLMSKVLNTQDLTDAEKIKFLKLLETL